MLFRSAEISCDALDGVGHGAHMRLGLDDAGAGDEKKLCRTYVHRADFKGLAHGAILRHGRAAPSRIAPLLLPAFVRSQVPKTALGAASMRGTTTSQRSVAAGLYQFALLCTHAGPLPKSALESMEGGGAWKVALRFHQFALGQAAAKRDIVGVELYVMAGVSQGF